jgi:uncharacterized membrane protein
MTDEKGAPTSLSRGRWMMIALVISLAVNLVFVGAGVARYVASDGPERLTMSRHMQLIPRKFLSELDKPRRGEILEIVRGSNKSFRDGRRAARGNIIELADALDAEPYDQARVDAAIDSFAASSAALVRDGSDAAQRVIAALTAPERKLLAKHLRLRESRSKAKPEAKSAPGSESESETP